MMWGEQDDRSERHARRSTDVLSHCWDRSRRTISLKLVGVSTALFLTVTFLDVLHLADRREAISFFGLSWVGITQHYWLHQFLTAPLMHAGVLHLLFNMLALWMLGPEVERILGQTRYIVFSILCATCSMVGFLLLTWGTGSIAVGYSGVIFGIFVAQAIFFPDNVIYLLAIFPMKMKHAVVLLAAIELYLTISPEGGGITHAAHLFGAAAALVYLKGDYWYKVLRGWPGAPCSESSSPKTPSRRKADCQRTRSNGHANHARHRKKEQEDIPWEL